MYVCMEISVNLYCVNTYFIHELYSITIITYFVVHIATDLTHGCGIVFQPTVISLISSQRHP